MRDDTRLLKEIYNKTDTSSKMLGAMLTHIDNKSLRNAVINQICEYDKINKEAGDVICEIGDKPKVSNPIKKKMQIWSTGMKCEANPSISQIAKMISCESSTTALDVRRTMNTCINSTPKVYNLGRKLLDSEEKNIQKMKPFL